MAIISALISSPPLYINEKYRTEKVMAREKNVPSMNLVSDHHDGLVMYYRAKELEPYQVEAACRAEGVNYKSLKHVFEATDQTLGSLRAMDFDQEATGSCRDWVCELGTEAETDEHNQLWSCLTVILGFGLEHFAVRREHTRKVWTGSNQTSQLTMSPGVPDVIHSDPCRPFFFFQELRMTDWSSKCSGVTAASPVAAILGAARDLSYDSEEQLLYVDGWAPVRMGPELAARLVSVRLGMRTCLLNVARMPNLLSENENIAKFRAMLFDASRSWKSDQQQQQQDQAAEDPFAAQAAAWEQEAQQAVAEEPSVEQIQAQVAAAYGQTEAVQEIW